MRSVELTSRSLSTKSVKSWVGEARLSKEKLSNRWPVLFNAWHQLLSHRSDEPHLPDTKSDEGNIDGERSQLAPRDSFEAGHRVQYIIHKSKSVD